MCIIIHIVTSSYILINDKPNLSCFNTQTSSKNRQPTLRVAYARETS